MNLTPLTATSCSPKGVGIQHDLSWSRSTATLALFIIRDMSSQLQIHFALFCHNETQFKNWHCTKALLLQTIFREPEVTRRVSTSIWVWQENGEIKILKGGIGGREGMGRIRHHADSPSGSSPDGIVSIFLIFTVKLEWVREWVSERAVTFTENRIKAE